ncbi:MAG TPA: phosphatase PAP2 family protein [Acidimicrobiales bacterium]|nr:phosphatase PAP2 family protein [Acidimicrobiales bacterium]
MTAGATGRRLVAAAGCCLAVAAIYVLAVRTATGQTLENAAMDGRPVHRWWMPNPTADRVAFAVTCTVLVSLVAVLAYTALTGPRARTLAAVTIVGVPVALAELLKHTVLGRPPLLDLGNQIYLVPNTFPSGHIAGASAAALVAVLVAPPARRGVVAVVGAAAASVAALGMLSAELHRPSDEIATCLITAATALVVVAVRPGAARVDAGAGPTSFRVPARALGAVGALALAVVAVGLPPLLAAVDDGGLVGPEYSRARGVGGAAVVATICLAVALVGRLSPPGWVAGPRTSDRGQTRPGADGTAPTAPYVASKADEGSTRCAGQLSSPVAAGDSGGRSPSGSRPTAGT